MRRWQGDSECGEHADSGNSDTVESHGDIREFKTRSEPVAEDNTGNNSDHWYSRRHHTETDTGDDYRGRSRFSAFGKATGRFI